MSRVISAGVLVRDQIDVYNPSTSFTRVAGILSSGTTLKLFVNNLSIPWTLLDGTSVADSSISAGYVYFNEIAGSPGFYSLRFFSDRTGFWRLVLSIVVNSAEIIKEYDSVSSLQGNQSGGLNATFLKP